MLLDPRLENSSSFITTLSLCQVRLSHNASFPWLLLIPQQPAVIEIIDLKVEDRLLLMQEISQASEIIKNLFKPDKINVATLGNIVPQLHIHLIARYKTDPAWPNPVWNTVDSLYKDSYKKELIDTLKVAFSIHSDL